MRFTECDCTPHEHILYTDTHDVVDRDTSEYYIRFKGKKTFENN
jgi:hypothetical protein